MCGPTVVTHGSDEQKQRYLRPLFTGEEIWCQLFSEPGAGSDLAGLATPRASATATSGSSTARRCGTRSRTSADRGMLVARTDPDVPKHKGLTYFVRRHARARASRCGRCARSPARPSSTRCTSPTCASPDADRIGDVGDGWRVSMTTLMNERVTIGGAVAPQGSGPIGAAVKLWQRHAAERPAIRRDATSSMQLWIEAEVLRLTNIRAAQNRKAGHARPRGLGRQARVRRVEQAHLRVRDEPARRRRDAHRRATTFARPEQRELDRRRRPAEDVPARRGRTRSRAARPRSCATSSASASSACPASRGSTRTCPGARCRRNSPPRPRRVRLRRRVRGTCDSAHVPGACNGARPRPRASGAAQHLGHRFDHVVGVVAAGQLARGVHRELGARRRRSGSRAASR